LAAHVKEAGGTLEVADDLPVLHADRTLLTQILTNLLGNAVTYRREGVDLRVRVDWRDEGESAVISVSDNGIGIPADYRDKVFNVFQRFQSDDEYPGTGIGLANVKKCVDLLGGSVWFESAEGEGTTFFVRLAKER
jgi:signal transduction histidine kinase